MAINSPTIIRFSKFFTSGLSSKFATNPCLNISPRLKCVATLPCEIWMSEKWHHSEIHIAINDESQGNIAKKLKCDKLLYYTFIIHSAGERIFKIGENLAKLQANWLTVSYTPFALHFRPQRCRSRQISWITCVLQTETVIKHCYVISRLMWVNYQELSTAVDQFWLTDWHTEAVSDLPTADHVRHFAATAFLCCSSCVQWVMGFFIWPM